MLRSKRPLRLPPEVGTAARRTIRDEITLRVAVLALRLRLRASEQRPTSSRSKGYTLTPRRGAVRIAYTSDGETAVALHLCDALGREVLTQTDANVAPDSAAFDLNGASLATGVYVYRPVSGGRSLSGSLSIVR